MKTSHYLNIVESINGERAIEFEDFPENSVPIFNHLIPVNGLNPIWVPVWGFKDVVNTLVNLKRVVMGHSRDTTEEDTKAFEQALPDMIVLTGPNREKFTERQEGRILEILIRKAREAVTIRADNGMEYLYYRGAVYLPEGYPVFAIERRLFPTHATVVGNRISYEKCRLRIDISAIADSSPMSSFVKSLLMKEAAKRRMDIVIDKYYQYVVPDLYGPTTKHRIMGTPYDDIMKAVRYVLDTNIDMLCASL